MEPKEYLVLAYYYFCEVKDPHREVKLFHQFLKGKDATGRIYISEEGINGQMSIHEKDAKVFMDWVHSKDCFKKMEFKVHYLDEHAFAKLTIKYREQLAALDAKVDMSMGGEHVDAKKWKEMLDNRDENTVLIDVRNNYEWKVGHFEGAEVPDLKTFREFPEYAKDLKKRVDPKKTKVMMYCTGGIRCELYSCLMKEEGFDEVFQLDGGIIKYGLEEGKEHWEGKLFVFDDRLVVPISDDNTETISQCHMCDTLCDTYYNCANMDCNDLFIACPECIEKMKGCCSNKCENHPRRRAFVGSENPKPYRKLRAEQKETLVN